MTEDHLRKVVREELADHSTEPRLLPVKAAARALGIPERSCWGLISDGRLRSLKVGKRRLVPVGALDEFVSSIDSGSAA